MKEEGKGDEYDWSTSFVFMEIKQWNWLKLFKGGGEIRKNDRRSEFDSSTLYPYYSAIAMKPFCTINTQIKKKNKIKTDKFEFYLTEEEIF
jgi:hypothetical protein